MNLNQFKQFIGYNKEWFDLDFLPLEFVIEQLQAFSACGDKDTENLKWDAYRYIMDHEDFNSNQRVDDFVKLIENDSNEYLFEDVLIELVNNGKIEASYLLKYEHVRFMKRPSIVKCLMGNDVV